jgi:hypothetical protein
VLEPDHWIFKGTGLKKGELVGKDGLNQARAGASGHELDTMDTHTPKNAILLAKGTNPKGNGSEMIYYIHKGGEAVFSVGSISFGNSLVVDQQLSTMLKNVIKRFLQR